MENKTYVLLFSGGRTSGFLVKYFLERNGFIKKMPVYYSKGKPEYFYHLNDKGDKCYVLFMNTGKERKETLKFVKDCDDNWGFKTIWLEAEIKYLKGVGTGFEIVSYLKASRDGKPFESMLKKYAMPNNRASNCTRELKQRPKEAFLRHLGLSPRDYISVVGIRADEAHRKSIVDKNTIYPLCDELKVDTKFIRNWWDRQNFDLELKDYQGNCDLCFKKSLKKRITIVAENPELALWWLVQEQKYSYSKVPRFDLRTNKSIEDIIEMSKAPFTKAEDLHQLDQQQKDLFDFETDCFCKSS